ncbi:hypothetical protein N7532_000673 [Penicillium argentinense]|uniref:Uncharacterized protein n=1 Tax=Penicillium argentinense TaxID=1131581 RepID=A0A9W9G5T3_9EURO|nr:uncharacterized protein N7532_000673 [Penicillium argentinense]KAJ5112628.1 hypothetical protein N7532_000673 [Penicillium argentinense]
MESEGVGGKGARVEKSWRKLSTGKEEEEGEERERRNERSVEKQPRPKRGREERGDITEDDEDEAQRKEGRESRGWQERCEICQAALVVAQLSSRHHRAEKADGQERTSAVGPIWRRLFWGLTVWIRGDDRGHGTPNEHTWADGRYEAVLLSGIHARRAFWLP